MCTWLFKKKIVIDFSIILSHNIQLFLLFGLLKLQFLVLLWHTYLHSFIWAGTYHIHCTRNQIPYPWGAKMEDFSLLCMRFSVFSVLLHSFTMIMCFWVVSLQDYHPCIPLWGVEGGEIRKIPLVCLPRTFNTFASDRWHSALFKHIFPLNTFCMAIPCLENLRSLNIQGSTFSKILFS